MYLSYDTAHWYNSMTIIRHFRKKPLNVHNSARINNICAVNTLRKVYSGGLVSDFIDNCSAQVHVACSDFFLVLSLGLIWLESLTGSIQTPHVRGSRGGSAPLLYFFPCCIKFSPDIFGHQE